MKNNSWECRSQDLSSKRGHERTYTGKYSLHTPYCSRDRTMTHQLGIECPNHQTTRQTAAAIAIAIYIFTVRNKRKKHFEILKMGKHVRNDQLRTTTVYKATLLSLCNNNENKTKDCIYFPQIKNNAPSDQVSNPRPLTV